MCRDRQLDEPFALFGHPHGSLMSTDAGLSTWTITIVDKHVLPRFVVGVHVCAKSM